MNDSQLLTFVWTTRELTQKCPIGDTMHNWAFQIGDWGLEIGDWGMGWN